MTQTTSSYVFKDNMDPQNMWGMPSKTFGIHKHTHIQISFSRWILLYTRQPTTAVQGTLKSLLQHHSSKTSILQYLAFFMVQLSHPYMMTGNTIVLTIQTFVGKVMSLLFNMLSRFFIAFSSKEQVSFNFTAAVTICSDFVAQENEVSHCFHCFPIYLPWSDGTRCPDLNFLNAEF